MKQRLKLKLRPRLASQVRVAVGVVVMGLVAKDTTVIEAVITRTWEPVPAPSHQASDVSTSSICHFLGYSLSFMRRFPFGARFV